ncbi:eukaryotic translation initiation factor 4E-like [Tetranychus urticae]|uniref:eIF-4F 25 kDa subunit n=1 Tax=Tetranychus urticae TaxID=32264 RepID=T1JZZ6_TETUR|nr:eukaryotic translation initiation factor 4E-like [Tetranychus urticae]
MTDSDFKNPLNSKWKLWYLKPSKGGDWGANLVPVTTVGTVEDFWALINHIELPSNLAVGSDYSLFRESIKPMWEDKGNYNGGRWLMTFDKQARGKLDDSWLEVLLCLIGEAFDDESDQVCGAVVNVRSRMTKISIWTSSCEDKAINRKIGKIVKLRTGYPDKMFFERHRDTAERGSKGIPPWDELE